MKLQTHSIDKVSFESKYHIDDLEMYRKDLGVFCCYCIDSAIELSPIRKTFSLGRISYSIDIFRPKEWSMDRENEIIKNVCRRDWRAHINNHVFYNKMFYLNGIYDGSYSIAPRHVGFEVNDTGHGVILPGREHDVDNIKAFTHDLKLFCMEKIEKSIEVKCSKFAEGVYVIFVYLTNTLPYFSNNHDERVALRDKRNECISEYVERQWPLAVEACSVTKPQQP